MDFADLFSRVALALGIGLLFGLERGWRTRNDRAGSRTAGIRTFAISGLLGGITGAIAQQWNAGDTIAGALVLVAGFATYAAVITAFARDENRAEGIFSATTTIAGLLSYLLGAYALIGDVRIAGGVAVAATAILAIRDELHGWVAKVTWPELRSGLVLLAMTFIALPILPDQPIGPFGGINPREVWLIAIALAAVSFLGYTAVKYLGQTHGVLLAGAAGGLVSSTAVTVTNARRAAAGEGSVHLLSAGVGAATAICFLRVFAIAAFLKPQLLVVIGPALLAAAIAALGFSFMSASRASQLSASNQEISFRNPFGFWSVLVMTAVLAAIIIVGRTVGETFGAKGALIGAILIGLADVDAITVSMARLTPVPLAPQDAGYAILAAVASDTASKVAIGALMGRGVFAFALMVMAICCFLAAGLAFGVMAALTAK